MSPALRRKLQSKIVAWGRRNFVAYPWRRRNKSAWLSLIAEVLLQRTRAEQVAPVYEAVARRYPAPEFMAREKPAALLGVVGTLGLHWRVPLMLDMARTVAEQGQPPDDYDELIELPGVGPYAAAAYLSMHRDRRAAIIDSNVVRLLGRFFGFEYDGETRRKSWLIELADELTPRRNYRVYNFAILDLAMTVCRAKPDCRVCPLARSECGSRQFSSPQTSREKR